MCRVSALLPPKLKPGIHKDHSQALEAGIPFTDIGGLLVTGIPVCSGTGIGTCAMSGHSLLCHARVSCHYMHYIHQSDSGQVIEYLSYRNGSFSSVDVEVFKPHLTKLA